MTKSINVNFKKFKPEAVIPTKAHPDDAGFDMVAVSVEETRDYIEIGTSIGIEIPKGHVGLLFPRSSNSKYDLLLCNSVGCVDSNYRGEVKFRFKKIINPNKTWFNLICRFFGKSDIEPYYDFNTYKVGDKVGQLVIMPYPEVTFNEVTELTTTDRGEGGFGSTDVKTDEVKRKRSRKKVQNQAR